MDHADSAPVLPDPPPTTSDAAASPEPPNTTPPPQTALESLDPPPASAAPTESQKATRVTRHTNPVRLLLVVIAVFVGLFLIIRTLAVEPFGVPTGSMAPALIGHHRDGVCPRCGYTVHVGRPSTGNTHDHFSHVVCPNCDFRFSLASAPDLSGDRLLVDKNIYSLRHPRRWEMVVFRCPDPDPNEFGKPYVKRLIGLPGETITIVDGDVYVNGQLARKGLAEVRETMMPVFIMAYVPKTDGWRSRWLVASETDPRLPTGTTGNKTPSPVLEGDTLVLDASESPQSIVGVTYRHWNLDDRHEEPIHIWNAYDGLPRHFGQLPTAHDFILSCEIEATATTTAEASFACRLLDGADAVSAEISVGQKRTGHAQLIRENHGGIDTVSGISLVPKRKYRLEFAFVDRRVMLALDGKLVMAPADLPPVAGRKDVSRPLQFGSRGCRIIIRDLILYRDIHYTQYGEHGTRHPVTLGPAEYYVLGDNSGNSQDSRKWPTPGVPEDDFIGKPVLIHQPLRLGRVSVGGRERVFQVLDWSRLRWLH